MSKAGLIPVKKQIKGGGNKAPYLAIRWTAPDVSVAPDVTKKRIKEFLQERKRKSYVTKYLKGQLKGSLNVDVYSASDLESVATISKKTGEKRYLRWKLDEIKNLIVFKKPQEVDGLNRYVTLVDGRNVPMWEDETIAKRKAKKFKRVKNIKGEKLESFRAKIKDWMNEKTVSKKKQLGTVIDLMLTFDIRVGTGAGGIEEGLIKTDDLKRGMVVAQKGAPEGTVPRLVVIREIDGVQKIFFRKMDEEEKVKRLQEVTKQSNYLRRKIVKKPDDNELKTDLVKVDQEKKALESEVDLPFSSVPGLKEMIRVGHYGATQLEARHIKKTASGELWLDFIGKSGVRWNKKIEDTDQIASVTKLLEGKAGQDRLFPDIKRITVAKEMDKIGGLPKDIRTYEGTKAFVEEAGILDKEGNWVEKPQNFPVPTTKKELKQIEKQIFVNVSNRLHNKPGMAKKAYVDPLVRIAWEAGVLKNIMSKVIQMQKSMFFVILDIDSLVKSFCREV
jgi:hypothetical protein